MAHPKTLPHPPTPTPDEAVSLVKAERDDAADLDTELLAARLVPLRRPGRWMTAALCLGVLALVIHSVATNPRFEWDVVGRYLTAPSVMRGLWLTIWLTVSVMVVGYILGVALAAMRLSGNPILRSLSFGYIWLIRSVPPLVQLLFWYELASLYPRLSLGIPFGHEFITVKTAHLFTGLLAAFVGLTLDVAAFSAEIIRGGLLSVEHGQIEAAQSIGLPGRRIFRRIVLPQAMPSIIPASGNLLIGMLKATSIVSVIAVQDLLYSVQLIYNQNYRIMPLLLVATIWYIILTSILSVGQYYVERYYSRGKRRAEARGVRKILRTNLPLRRGRSSQPVVGA
jgi:polar amino acid transport system permease protein